MDRDILNEPHTKEFNCVKGLNQFLDWAWGCRGWGERGFTARHASARDMIENINMISGVQLKAIVVNQ